MSRGLFAAGCIFAFLGVAAGAFGAHALSARIPAERLATYEIAVRYQMYHALGLLAFALASSALPAGALRSAGWLMSAGIVVFSGTLFGIAFGGPRWLGAITPIGGLCFLTAWLLAGWMALRG
jgi:uncharacterized membrane protein YgdD (TMEM256/DUF423 family)